MKKLSVYCFLLLLVSCCSNKTEFPEKKPAAEEATNLKPSVVPADSMREPLVVTAGKADVANLRTGLSFTAGTSSSVFSSPEIINVEHPIVTKPGSNGLSYPTRSEVNDTLITCVNPDPVITDQPRYKDEASLNIQYLDVGQNFPSSYVSKIYSDKEGYIWCFSKGGLTRFDGRTIYNYSSKNGLPKGVSCITEDRNSNFWMGVQGGLVKYDGTIFTYYRLDSTFRNTSIRGIAEDKLGDIWFGTARGLCSFNGRQVTRYSTAEGLIHDNVTNLIIDKKGNVWCGTSNGISCFDGRSFTSFNKENGLTTGHINALAESKNGNIWIATEEGASEYDGKNFIHHSVKSGMLNNAARALYCDHNGNIWIGTYRGGLTCFDGKKYTHITEREGLTVSTVWAITQDKAGNIWMGTDGGGLCKFTPGSFSHFTANNGMSQIVLGIREDKNGRLWFGTYGGGMYHFDEKSFTSVIDPKGTLTTVWSIGQDKDSNLVFGTESSGFSILKNNTLEYYSMTQGLPGNNITSIAKDKDGNLWLGTMNGAVMFNGSKFIIYTKEQGLLSENVRAICCDKKGNVWIGTMKGLNKFDGKNMQRITEKEGLSGNNIKNIYEDRNGAIWIGTLGNGVNIIKDGKLRCYSAKNGLSNDYIRSIVEDGINAKALGGRGIWLSTDNGIDHLVEQEGEQKITVFTRSDGLKGEDFCSNSGHQDSKGRTWWGSIKSLTMLDPQVHSLDQELPEAFLQSIHLEQTYIDFRSLKDSIEKDKNYFINEKRNFDFSSLSYNEVPAFRNYPLDLKLPYDINTVTFNFSAINWSSLNRTQYKFMLEGADKDWHPVTSETKALYPGLRHGTYTFKVKAKGLSDSWGPVFDYQFVIRPPWWNTIYAYLIYLAGFIMIGVTISNQRTRKLLRRQKELEKTIIERTADVVEEKNKVEEKNQIIVKKQKEILDSINYAKQIQYSLLANEELITRNLPQHFVLFKPKDIVSGDFYWGTNVNQSGLSEQQSLNSEPLINAERFYLAVCDSTGHGVPGAFVSLLNISFLSEAITDKRISEPGKILDYVRERLIKNVEGQDGMDGTLALFEKEKLLYASAHNKPILIRKKEIIELNADKMPVGKGERKNPFQTFEIELQPGDNLYFYTDGFADQFGGPKGKKYKYKQLNELLLSVSELPVKEQRKKIEETFYSWKGELEQVDDVCIIGVRL